MHVAPITLADKHRGQTGIVVEQKFITVDLTDNVAFKQGAFAIRQGIHLAGRGDFKARAGVNIRAGVMVMVDTGETHAAFMVTAVATVATVATGVPAACALSVVMV